jgi:hypothetical protein
LAASSRQAESSFPRKSPPSHSAIQCTRTTDCDVSGRSPRLEKCVRPEAA